MLLSSLLAFLALPLFAVAQTTGTAQPQSPPQQTVITFTSLSSFVTLGPDRQASTATRTVVFTTTQILTPAPQPSSVTTNGTIIPAGNNTASTSSTTTTPLNFPTAPTNVDGGGLNGAPQPGQTGVGGIYGPDDNYIAAAASLKQSVFIVTFVGLVVGGALVAF